MKQRVRIVTVDPPTRRIEGALKDGGGIRISLYEVPSNFRWPKEQEIWTVNRVGNEWYLGDRHELDDDVKIEDLNPGDVKIAGSRIVDERGHEVVAIEGTVESRPNASVPAWDATDGSWKPVPGGTVGTPDKNFRWSQGVASKWWGTPTDDPSATVKHNLDKRPAVQVMDSAGTEVVVNVQHVNDNEVRITLDAPFSGEAYFN